MEWGRGRLVKRHPAWDAVFRYLAPLAAAGDNPARPERRGEGESVAAR